MRWIFPLLLAATSTLAAHTPPPSIVADPAALVNESVDVISGGFQQVVCDMEVVCAEPIRVYRAHASYDSMKRHWRPHYEYVWITQDGPRGWVKVFIAEPTGRVISFNGRARPIVPLLPDETCNTHWGALSGQTDVRNWRLDRNPAGNMVLTTGDGQQRIYKMAHGHCLPPRDQYGTAAFLLSEVKRPNGRKLTYSYDSQNRLLKITAMSPDEAIELGWAAFDYADGRVTITGSDGQRVEHTPNTVELTTATYQGKLEHQYAYDSRKALARVALPNKRELAIEYLHEHASTQAAPGETVQFLGSGRVHKQLATTGDSPTPQPMDHFYYYHGKKKDKNSPAKIEQTNVVNANGGITSFIYPEGRLQNRTRFTPDEAGRLPIDGFERVWDDEGRLVRERQFATGNVALPPTIETFYMYDKRGNVVCETVVGDRVSHTRRSAFSNDGFNLKTQETDGVVKKTYTYVPGTNLLREACEYERGVLTRRTTYAYDNSAVCILTREEWGPQVKTREVTPREDGLPEWVEELINGHLIRKTRLHYNQRNWVTQKDIFDADGMHRYSTYTDYDEFGRVVMEMDAEGNIQHFTYDENGNCTNAISPCDHETRYRYDFANHLLSKELDGLKIEYEYDAMGNKVLERDECGNETHYIYDSHGRCIREIGPAIATPEGLLSPETRRAYDGLDRVLSETNPRGNTTRYTYNGRGQVLSITPPDGSVEKRSYYPDGRLKSETGKNRTKVKYVKDHLDRVLKTITKSADGEILRETSCVYEGPYKVSETDADGYTTTYQYNKCGRLAEECKEGHRITYHYDSLGRRVEQREYYDSTGYVATRWQYDLLDRVIAEQIGDNLTTYAYDADGNQVEVSRHLGPHRTNTTTIEYDAQKLPIKETDALGNETLIEYRYDGTLTKITTDALGNRTLVFHDPASNPHLIQKENRVGQLLAQQEVLRDLCGNIVEHQHTVMDSDRIVTTQWEYDCCNRWVTLTEGAGSPTSRITRRIYNDFGQLVRTIKPSNIQLFRAYDPFGRLASYQGPDFSYVYTYDLNDRLVEVDSQGRKTYRTYDAMGRVVAETLEIGATLQRTFDEMGRPTRLILPDDSSVKYAYDGHHLKQVAYGNYVHTYLYRDRGGNVLEALLPSGVKVSYSYDDLERLRSINTYGYSQSIDEYDQVGNILKLTTQGETLVYTYDDLYQLSSEPGHTYQHDSLFNRTEHNNDRIDYNALNQDCAHTYSEDGYILSDDNAKYTYDSLGRLIGIDTAKCTLSFTYDPFNRRLSKTVTTVGVFGKNHSKQDYLYDGSQEIGTTDLSELRILGEGYGAEIGASVLLRLHGTVYMPVHDHRGSIAALLDAYHSPVECRQYSSFGLAQSSISPWGFLSKRHDETGLVYFGQRYYAPASGRWLTPDPLGYKEGPNLYAYCHNNPLTKVDWWGLNVGHLQSYGHITDPHRKYDPVLASASRAATFSSTMNFFHGMAYGLVCDSPCNPDIFKYKPELPSWSLTSWIHRGISRIIPQSDPNLVKLRFPAKYHDHFDHAYQDTTIGLTGVAIALPFTIRSSLNAYQMTTSHITSELNTAIRTPPPLNRFHQAAKALTPAGKNNIRILRNWAKSKGWVREGNRLGKPERWGQYVGKEFHWHLRIKPEGSLRSGLHPLSNQPRFDARLKSGGDYIDPFSGKVGSYREFSHLPLESPH